MKKILTILFVCIGLNAFGQGLEPITTTNLRVIMSKINELQGLVGTGGLSQQQVSNIVKDSIDAVIDRGIDLDQELQNYEPTLGNPISDGYVLSSTTTGVRSWIAPAQGGGNGYDDTAINNRIDSLGALVDALQIEAQNLRDEVNNLWSALAKLGDFDLVPPRFYSAEVGNYLSNVVVVTLDTSDVDVTSVPPASAFTLWDDGLSHKINSTSFVSDSLIYLTLDSAAVYGRVYTLDYTKGTPALQDSTGNETASWAGRQVVNNVAEPIPSVEDLLMSPDTYGWYIYDSELNKYTEANTVWLLNDISQGNELSSQLIANNEFTSADGWTLGDGWSIANGVATGTTTDAHSNLTYSTGIDNTYRRVVVMINSISGSYIQFHNSYPPYTTTSNGEFARDVWNYTTVDGILKRNTASCEIESISIYRYSGHHLGRAGSYTSRFPAYNENYIEFDGTDDALVTYIHSVSFGSIYVVAQRVGTDDDFVLLRSLNGIGEYTGTNLFRLGEIDGSNVNLRIKELIISLVEHTTVQQNLIESYLNTKYGL